MLKVSEISGSNLPNIEKSGKIDPYVSLEYLGVSKKTENKDDDLNPSYGEVFEWDLQGKPIGPGDSLEVTVKDYERIGRNRLVGTASIALRDLLQPGKNSKQFSVTLLDGNKRPTNGKISLKVDYVPPKGSEPATGGGDDRQQGELGGEGEDGDEEGGEEGGEGGEAGEGGGEGPESFTDAGGTKRRRKRQRRKRVMNLPDKPTDFQVRVKVIEGRQLAGANISPVVRVTVGKETRQTRVKHSTNKPYFNETFFYNFNMRPNELLDEIVNFEVFNSRKLRSDALIGAFQCDVGLVWDQDNHALVRKWILLTAPEDKMGGSKEGEGEEEKGGGAQAGSPTGYIKVTAFVLGPGDEIPDAAKGDGKDDSEDIESNLLRPAGVTLRPATFLVKIYRAEDVPQMDPGYFEGVKKILRMGDQDKELVDPYVKFSFAGQRAKTKIFTNNDHPEFNQELRVSFKFPSMCERLKLQMFDWDRVGNDDCIGTEFIPISSISGQGDDGFLPCFGPCFVNFYGSTREFSDLPDEYDDLNLGRGEGVAYRGRVLVEIDTRFGDHAQEQVHDIMAQELVRVQTYLRRRKFKLFASFLSATLVSEVDGPVEFEVSIGNYGNKLDSSVPPSASSTPPTNPVFDGSSYYYLPWNDQKPCCVVESHWEDIYFRLEPLNIILRIVDQLTRNMKKVQLAIDAKAKQAEIAALLISLLDNLIAECSKPLPQFDASVNGVNELDLKLQEIRGQEFATIVDEATKLREVATDVNEAMDEIHGYMQRLKDMCEEPQNSVPDVVIWMLSGNKRIAYYRIPAYEVMYFANPSAKGKFCAKIQNLFLKYPGKKGRDIEDHPEIPGCVRVILWFGLEKDQENWTSSEGMEGEYSVFAETYENQMSIPIVGWTSKGVPRPSFSDDKGNVRLNKEAFHPPEGWKWDGDWFVDPELSLSFEADQGHKNFLEDAFENESRIPAGNWGLSSVAYTDVRGDPITHRNEIKAPEGWEWVNDWKVDVNRAVDEEGWEYCVEATLAGWGPVEKTYHLCRRRRWVRTRVAKSDPSKESKKLKQKQLAAEGWEYAPVFTMKFHLKERKVDMVRRRRWHRKMIQDQPGAPAVFNIDTGDKDKPPLMMSPRMFLSFEKPHRWQLRAYIYQARDVLAKDKEGVSDPYAKVAFENQSQITRVIKQTVCPDWDQTLIFEDLNIYDNPKLIADSPPNVVIEIFDKDQVGKDEYLGRCAVQPVVKLPNGKASAPKLLWYPIMRGEDSAGELLAAFELFLDEGVDLPFSPPLKDGRYIVPNGIRPVMVRTGIEVLCWGVRNMKKYQLANVSSPSIAFEVGGHILNSSVIKNVKRNPNFDQSTLFFDVYLPKEELYAPPMNIKVHDNRSFGRKPVVGTHVVKSLAEFRKEPLTQAADEEVPAATGSAEHKADVVLAIEEKKKKKRQKILTVIGKGVPKAIKHKVTKHAFHRPKFKRKPKLYELLPEEIFDWWSKYFASTGDLHKAGDYLEKGYDKLMIYNKELEETEDYNGFKDFVKTFYLRRGKDEDDEDEPFVGEFKGLFRTYPLPPDPQEPLPPKFFKSLPDSKPVECTVRVYVIKAIELKPQDPGGKADPYLVVELGKQKISEKDKYKPNTIDPIFGSFFELTASIPVEKDLKIRVMDYDFLSRDDLIGETLVDLENRYLSKFRATCGLPANYYTSGPFQWRDCKSPKQVLETWAERNSIRKPQFLSNTQLAIEGQIHNLEDYEDAQTTNPHLGPPDERLALHVLNTKPLVKEHIETRSLYNPLMPNMDQGQLQMWVDIFPKSFGPPGPPINVMPREPGSYELRVIIWNCAEVTLDETSITGEKMSDIYIKGWLEGDDESQKTDVHYRSLNGEGNFNWRLVYPFDYLPAEKVMVIKKKEHFWSLDKTEERMPPKFVVQIWDNDKFSADDFLGNVELQLTSLPKPAKSSKACTLDMVPHLDDHTSRANVETVDLFQMKRAYGWWPMYMEEGGQRSLAGKMEMTLEIVSGEEAAEKPAGKGREDPNQNPKLDPPNRPETSFLWFTSPWKTLKFIIWRNYKWYIIGFFIAVIIILLVVLFVYSMPGYAVKRIFGA